MIVLCDTCSVLMLIRIAPDMFRDPGFECVTIKVVYDEIFQTRKFKEKYPWRNEYKDKVNFLGVNTYEGNPEFSNTQAVIKEILSNGVVNEKNGRLINLSPEDQLIAVYSVVNDYAVTTTDIPLKAFLQQELEREVYSPLGIINYWIKKGALIWSESLHNYLALWKSDEEPPQPAKDIAEYKKLMQKQYPGP